MLYYEQQYEPNEVGVYACRVPDELIKGFYKDIFLMWHDNRWGYLGSPVNYRGEVSGWIGPLQRKLG